MSATQTQRPTEQEREAALIALGFTLESSQPGAGVDEAQTKDGTAWPHIAFTVSLHFKGREVLRTPYKLGIGHVDPKKAGPFKASHNFGLEDGLLHAWRKNPHASFKDKALQASVAARLAKAQGIKPSLPGALHSLLSDGEAFFNAKSFEDWAGDFGYDSDSRKAEETYRACDAIGRKLAQGIPKAALDKAREILADY